MSVAFAWLPGCFKVCLLDGLVFLGGVPHGRQIVFSRCNRRKMRRTHRIWGSWLVAAVVVGQDQAEARLSKTLRAYSISLRLGKLCYFRILLQALASQLTSVNFRFLSDRLIPISKQHQAFGGRSRPKLKSLSLMSLRLSFRVRCGSGGKTLRGPVNARFAALPFFGMEGFEVVDHDGD